MRLLLHILKTDCFAPLFCSVLFSLDDQQPPPQRETRWWWWWWCCWICCWDVNPHTLHICKCAVSFTKSLLAKKSAWKTVHDEAFFFFASFLQSGVGRRKTRFDVTFMNAHVHTLALSFRSGSSSTMENWGKSCVRVCFCDTSEISCHILRQYYSQLFGRVTFSFFGGIILIEINFKTHSDNLYAIFRINVAPFLYLWIVLFYVHTHSFNYSPAQKSPSNFQVNSITKSKTQLSCQNTTPLKARHKCPSGTTPHTHKSFAIATWPFFAAAGSDYISFPPQLGWGRLGFQHNPSQADYMLIFVRVL